jgi:cysteine-rich repeat protein
MLTRTTIALAFLAKPFLVCNPQPTPAVTGEGSSSSESTDTTDPTDTMTEPTLTMTEPPSSTTTVEPMCGNGMQEEGEECDDGNDDPADACLNNCKNAACGDDQVRADDMPEECDDGDQLDTNDCTAACKKADCGDSIVSGREECDDGANNVPKEQASAEQCTTECMVACADGTQSSMEECDDGNLEANDGCSPACTDEFIMFVTAETHPANFGGIAGADAICQMAAMGKLTGTYVASVSVDGSPAVADIPVGKTVIRPDGMIIVDAAEKLFAGNVTMLANTISIDVDGNPVEGYAWTGTTPSGQPSGGDCIGWTDTMQKLTDGGAVASMTFEWTKAGDTPLFCNEEHHLYCFRKLDL